MTTFHAVPTPELLERAIAAARRDPSREADERWDIIRELHRRGDESIRDAAKGWCVSPDALMRCLGADVLGQLGFSASHPHAEDSEPLLTAMLADPDESVLACALVALAHLGAGDPGLVAAHAGHRSDEVREAVAFCLAKRDEPAARDALITLSVDRDAEVRNWATCGLGALSDADSPAIREALAARLDDEDDEVRGEAMRGLAARGDRRAVPYILDELEQDEVMDLAIEAAALLPDSRYLPALEELSEQLPDSADLQKALDQCKRANRQS